MDMKAFAQMRSESGGETFVHSVYPKPYGVSKVTAGAFLVFMIEGKPLE
jgi:hypothetical protein